MRFKIPSRTKIVATVGPACDKEEILKEMILSGVDVFRLNFSHGSHEAHLEAINKIKNLRRELDISVAILGDLQGPKLRIGEVENNGVELKEGEIIEITNEKCMGTSKRVYLSYEPFAQDVSPGEPILIDDGKLKIEVIETNGKDLVKAKIIHGGILSSKKGVNLPGTKLSIPSLTEKDRNDLDFAIEQKLDWIALSFVRYATDIVDLKSYIKKKKKNTAVIAKIEKPEALEEIDNIIDLTDGIMVARGDLGVEVNFERVPVIQKQIVNKCIEAGKPVIIATQMMESMITNFRPGRAEATDVANAVVEGADALMLSGETSVGKHPVEVIKSMHEIIEFTEKNTFNYYRSRFPKEFSISFLADSICYNACNMAQKANAKAIVVFTWSGDTAYKILAQRPQAKVFAFTQNKNIKNKLALGWGVEVIYMPFSENIDIAIDFSIQFLKEKKLIVPDDIVVHVGSTPLHKRASTNMLKMSYV